MQTTESTFFTGTITPEAAKAQGFKSWTKPYMNNPVERKWHDSNVTFFERNGIPFLRVRKSLDAKSPEGVEIWRSK